MKIFKTRYKLDELLGNLGLFFRDEWIEESKDGIIPSMKKRIERLEKIQGLDSYGNKTK